MTNVLLYRRGDGTLVGFRSSGHAGDRQSHRADMVCSAISALTQTAVNAIEALTGVAMSPVVGDGLLELVLPAELEPKQRETCDIILRTLAIGITGIETSYPGYIRMAFKEWRQ